MKAAKRQKQILDLLAREGNQTVDYLAQILGVSVATVRRDLSILDSEGRAIRTHGGVRIGVPPTELSVAQKSVKNHAAKIEIARIAVSHINDFDTLIVDAGTTTELVAKMITGHNLTIVTNSITALSVFLSKSDMTVIILGGTLRAVNQAIIGSSAINQVRTILADRAFIGAYEFILGHGITSPTPSQATLKTAMMESAKEIYVVADSSKFSAATYKFISPVPRRATIITDSGINPDVLSTLEKQQSQVLIAELDPVMD